MTISAKVILDSIAPNGCRLTTFELTYPRFIHSELMTHRVFSRNAASSRAVPVSKKVERIRQDMAKPVEWGVNQKGMQAGGPLPPELADQADALWTGLGLEACEVAERMDQLGLHKQVANRVIEPWDHITVVLSTTKLNNHKKLRTEVDKATGRPLPDPNYFELATKMHAAVEASVPQPLGNEQWHLPYVEPGDAIEVLRYLERVSPDSSGERIINVLKKVSVGRCARVSYLRQGQGDVEENVKLHDRLLVGHWAPFEHVATPIGNIKFHNEPFSYECEGCTVAQPMRKAVELDLGLDNIRILCDRCSLGHVTSGNFTGWKQYRKEFADEAGGD